MLNNKLFLSAVAGAAVCCMPVFAKEPAHKQTDRQFLAMAAEADMTTAHLGKEAEDHGGSDKIKDLGKTLVRDHTKDYEELSEVAAKVGDTIPKGIDKADDREINSLDRNKGKSFDHAFLMQERAEHEKLIRVFKEEAEHGSNPEIKAYANQALPVIERHLHEVEDLLKSRA